MKSRKTHRVPLVARTVKIAEALRKEGGGEYVFAGGKAGESLSNMAMLALLKRMGCDSLTVHGFRSTFRDWVAEQTSYPSELAEMALAHVVTNTVEAAYRRGDLFMKRQKMMEAWAAYCMHGAPSDKVVPMLQRMV